MIYQELTKNDFMDAFNRMGRREQFSYEALSALYDYILQATEDTGEDYELDVIQLCCDWSEYESVDEVEREHVQSIEHLKAVTEVIELNNGGFLVAAY